MATEINDMTTIIKARTKNQLLTITERPIIASGDVNTVVVHFEFDPAWSAFTVKYACFHKANQPHIVYKMLISDDGYATVPHEVLGDAGDIFFGVKGYIHDSPEIVKTSLNVKYSIQNGSDYSGGKTPTPDEFAQMMQEVGDIKQNVSEEMAAMNATMQEFDENDEARTAAEILREEQEDARLAAENTRVNNEAVRVESEERRVRDEAARYTAEFDRRNAENDRQREEALRVSGEEFRDTNEAVRQKNESFRIKAENERAAAEQTRGSNEAAREAADLNRAAQFEAWGDTIAGLKKEIRGIVDITISEITDEDENTGNDNGDTGGGSGEITGGYTLVLHDYDHLNWGDPNVMGRVFTSDPMITFADGHKEAMQFPADEESITYNHVTKVGFYTAVDGAVFYGTGDFELISMLPNTYQEVTLTQDSTISHISK